MGLKSTLMGKPATGSEGESGNHAYEDISKAFSPGFNYFTQGGNMLGNMLGANGGSAQTGALENYANSGGMQFLMKQGQNAITSSKAAQGLLNSGSYGTALAKYGQGLASTYLDQFLNHTTDLAKLGLGAGQLVGQTGEYSSQTGGKPAKQGILPSLIQIGAAIGTGGASAAAGAGAAGAAGGLSSGVFL